ncbi:MAG: polyprenyl synthetase family protein, partial [Myxococcota bacterium]
LVLKSLGAGGGDSIGCFYNPHYIEIGALNHALHTFKLQVRLATCTHKGVCASPHEAAKLPLPSLVQEAETQNQSATATSHPTIRNSVPEKGAFPMDQEMLKPYQQHAQKVWNEQQQQCLLDPALAPMLKHHFQSTGKLIRPALAMSFYDLLTQGTLLTHPQPPKPVCEMAIALELLHNGTLIHDDLQDGDAMRRGIPTVWKAFDAYQAINAGSALYFHTLRIFAQLDVPHTQIATLCQLLSEQTLQILSGQALEKQLWQLFEQPHPPSYVASSTLYLSIVQKKTSALFALPLMCAATLADLPYTQCLLLQHIAHPLGAAFQIQDDILDLYGKKGRDKIGSDIAEGKPSLLALSGLAQSSPEQAQKLYEIIRAPRTQTQAQDIQWAIKHIQQSEALDRVVRHMESLYQEASHAITQHFPREQEPLQRFLKALYQTITAPIQHLLP